MAANAWSEAQKIARSEELTVESTAVNARTEAGSEPSAVVTGQIVATARSVVPATAVKPIAKGRNPILYTRRALRGSPFLFIDL